MNIKQGKQRNFKQSELIMKKTFLGVLAASLFMFSCSGTKQEQPELTKSGLDKTKFQAEFDGKKSDLYVLANANGMEVTITNMGGRIVSIMVPDKDGNMKDVALGFDNVADYKNIPNDFGATIGRYANRIGNATFELDGTKYTLPANNGPHCLHGGPNGYQYQMFDAKQNGNTLELTYLSKDGEEGFPSNLNNKVTFTLTDNNEIKIDYEATTDKPTVINLTNHSYFNLAADGNITNSDWLISINADSYTPIDSTFATTGEILPVEGTDFDLRQAVRIGDRIDNDWDQLKNGRGFDHNWVLNAKGDINTLAASLVAPATGIKLEVFTTEPGLQFYAGNFLDGTVTGRNGVTYQQRTAVCLESQKYPDTPNKADWPSATLRPGETYKSQTIFKFSVEK